MSNTKIITCNCNAKCEYQDKRYGFGRRVANWAKKAMGWRCTVCGNVQSAQSKEK